MISLTKKEFKEYYPNMTKYRDIFYRDFKSDEDFIDNFLPSKLWRINNLYKIIDKKGAMGTFRMRRAQHKVYRESLIHPRLIVLKSRQQGISTLWLISFLDDAIFVPNMNVGLMAQGKDEASTMLGKARLAWDYLDLNIKQHLNIDKKGDNKTELAFNNNSTMFIRTSFRSATLHRLHISEYGKICNKTPSKADETKTGTLQTIAPGNPVIIESTAEGQNNFMEMWDTAVEFKDNLAPMDFNPVFLPWTEDVDCKIQTRQIVPAQHENYLNGLNIKEDQKWYWVTRYRELGDKIHREYPATPEEAFRVNREGTYYAKLYTSWVRNRGREVSDLYDSNLPVYCSMDIGWNDYHVLLFFQRYEERWMFIDEYCNRQESAEHYVDKMREKPFKIEETIFPHDVKKTSIDYGKSLLDRFIELGVKNYSILKHTGRDHGKEAGREQVKKIMKNLYVDEKCTYTINCFYNYSRKWDATNGIYGKDDKKDEFVHGADAIRYAAMSGISGYRNKIRSNVVGGMAL